LPAARRIWLHNPTSTDFENELLRIKGLASSLRNTLLVFHYTGHGFSNGGFIGLFGDSCFINFTAQFSMHFDLYPNIWVVMAFDACLDPLPDDLKMNLPLEKKGGLLKIHTLLGTHLGFEAYDS
jgi:hypothetical protein